MMQRPVVAFWRTIMALLCAMAMMAAPACADAPQPAAWGLSQLMHELAQVKTSKARFVERKYLAVLKTPLESSGTLVYIAPDHLEKNTLLPKPERLVVDADRLTFESEARRQRRTIALQDYPEIWAFVESIRSTLAGDAQALGRFYKIDLEGDATGWTLLLRPNDPSMQALVQAVRISGKDNVVQTIEILEVGGDRSVMTVQKVAP